MPADNAITYSMGLDPVSTIAICAFAAVVLFLAILAVVLLFKQKSLLAQINNTLARQGVPGSAAPVPNTCPKCGAAHTPGAGFCQNCGAAL
jgi:hypothetical protein